MRRLILALRAFWRTLLRREFAEAVRSLLQGQVQPQVEAPPKQKQVEVEKPRVAPAEKAPPSARSEALTLLATLQREARFVDFIMESLDQYTDAQIGAAVRDIHRDCARVIDRIFGLRAIVTEGEGSAIELSGGYDAARFRVLGEVQKSGPFRARVIHRGWEATRCQLPMWSGSPESAMVIAPAEVQVEGTAVPRLGEGFALPPEQ